jgi:hypothetical protein
VNAGVGMGVQRGVVSHGSSLAEDSES